VKPGDWAWTVEHRQSCRVLDIQSIWGEITYRVWLPAQDTVVRVRADQLKPLDTHHPLLSTHHLAYVAAAARVADALTQNVLLAPIEASVIPLPHQIRVLSRAVSHDRVRYLLADEVGLGKTIEAGLIMRELKLRGLVRRVLVVAPKGLVTQWVSEMRLHFHEEFRLVLPEHLTALRRMSSVQSPKSQVQSQEERLGTQDSGPWTLFDQVVVPLDSVKPLDKRRGWTTAEVAEYNRERYDDLIAAGWDLVIVDEAHRLGGSTDQVARYKLGQGVAEAAPYLLLLSATPHQGKTDVFHRLISLLDPSAFPDLQSVTRERVQPYVLRTEKRCAIDAHGRPLFKPRQTRLLPVVWEDRHQQQHAVYQDVTAYVRQGYNRAIQEKRNYIGFLMTLMQRLVTSSTRAISTTRQRRLEVMSDELRVMSKKSLEISFAEWEDLDPQEQLELVIQHTPLLAGLQNEHDEVELLLEQAAQTEAAGSDAKAEALLEWIYRLQQEEGDPDLKVLVFTEFVPTQEMLYEFLTARGFSVVCLNGSMDLEERREVQETFAGDARILLSTDAGGEGLNLQFCHVVVNYDIPWNPMRLEQRIGRADRIGQMHIVRALNLVLEGTIEHRVQEVLQEKLAVILEEFGVDKTGDILDSAEAEQLFDDLYKEAILHPERVESSVDSVLTQVRYRAEAVRESSAVLTTEEPLDPSEAQRVMEHPLPHWVERMTIAYLHSAECEVRGAGKQHPGAEVIGHEGRHNIWQLTWPDGHQQVGCFTTHDALRTAHLGLEDPRIRDLVTRLPRFAPGQSIPCFRSSQLPEDVDGVWSLWHISVQSHAPRIQSASDRHWTRDPRLETRYLRVMPLFLHTDGRVLVPTARRTWDLLLTDLTEVASPITGTAAVEIFHRQLSAAETYGKTLYDEIIHAHRDRLAREREKSDYAFTARRRALERVGLVTVRAHRLTQLAQEEQAWRTQFAIRTEVSPELVPIIIVKVMSEGN
jgi:SNF2 family DNA or RNA helicase